ncbi:hypothetical protein L5515_015142 [Caenorhabditis briggsae]|uniref:Uncharacterized protein n=1 Tax=Caenorhabditis briggsae TaxID=6238 RepID=A0AAE9EDC9_CAEBR|nr:hypothetical protein L5515_015142 [Caenorhabditis briggsae]
MSTLRQRVLLQRSRSAPNQQRRSLPEVTTNSPFPSACTPPPTPTTTESTTPTVPSIFEKKDGLFNDSSKSPISSNPPCICFNCWGPWAASGSSKNWRSPDNLVHSDVLTEDTTIYDGGKTTNSSCATTINVVTDVLASPIRPSRIQEENLLLKRKAELQNEIISKLLEVGNITDELARLLR